jgi:hypothetical protein
MTHPAVLVTGATGKTGGVVVNCSPTAGPFGPWSTPKTPAAKR